MGSQLLGLARGVCSILCHRSGSQLGVCVRILSIFYLKKELISHHSTALAHDIHEQILVHKRSLFLVGHTFGAGYILDDDVRSAFLPPITNVTRKEDLAMASFTPIFNTLSEVEIERLEREREKDNKRKKRATRGRRGVILPDREPMKTQRSLLSNGVDPNGVIVNPPSIEVAPVQTSRRAAAIAAQANINLLAQDLPIPQPPSPVPHHPNPVGRPRGRGGYGGRGRGGSRASPSVSGREDSVLHGFNSHSMETPNAGYKRQLREDSGSEVNSPAPSMNHLQRKRRIIDTPEDDRDDRNNNGVKAEVDETGFGSERPQSKSARKNGVNIPGRPRDPSTAFHNGSTSSDGYKSNPASPVKTDPSLLGGGGGPQAYSSNQHLRGQERYQRPIDSPDSPSSPSDDSDSDYGGGGGRGAGRKKSKNVSGHGHFAKSLDKKSTNYQNPGGQSQSPATMPGSGRKSVIEVCLVFSLSVKKDYWFSGYLRRREVTLGN